MKSVMQVLWTWVPADMTGDVPVPGRAGRRACHGTAHPSPFWKKSTCDRRIGRLTTTLTGSECFFPSAILKLPSGQPRALAATDPSESVLLSVNVQFVRPQETVELAAGAAFGRSATLTTWVV